MNQKESESSIQQTSHIDYLRPNVVKTKSKNVYPMPVPIHSEIAGDTEVIFPSDLRFGGNLLKSMKKDYAVSQYTVVSESDSDSD